MDFGTLRNQEVSGAPETLFPSVYRKNLVRNLILSSIKEKTGLQERGEGGRITCSCEQGLGAPVKRKIIPLTNLYVMSILLGKHYKYINVTDWYTGEGIHLKNCCTNVKNKA